MGINWINVVITLLIVYGAFWTCAFIGLIHLDDKAFDMMLDDIFGDRGYDDERTILKERYEWHRMNR